MALPQNQPFLVGFWPGARTSTIGELPDFAIEPMAFSTILFSPPFLLPGVVLALVYWPALSSHHTIAFHE
jgi:hypothetical protein